MLELSLQRAIRDAGRPKRIAWGLALASLMSCCVCALNPAWWFPVPGGRTEGWIAAYVGMTEAQAKDRMGAPDATSRVRCHDDPQEECELRAYHGGLLAGGTYPDDHRVVPHSVYLQFRDGRVVYGYSVRDGTFQPLPKEDPYGG